MGCFWAVEDGLMRSECDRAKRSFVFPKLHSIKDATVARNLTAIIRDNLPPFHGEITNKDMEEKKNLFNVTSLRRGGVTVLNSANLTLHQSCARSGHSTGTNQDSYWIRDTSIASVPGGLILCGRKEYNSMRDRITPPSLDWLGSEATLGSFVEELIPSNMPEFLPNGHLEPLRGIAAASLVMHYQSMLRDFGPSNKVITKLRHVSEKCGIVDSRFRDQTPTGVLNEWSHILQRVFAQKNTVTEAANDIPSIASTVNRLSDVLGQVVSGVDALHASQDETSRLVHGTLETLVAMEKKVEELQSDRRSLKRKLRVIRTPE